MSSPVSSCRREVAPEAAVARSGAAPHPLVSDLLAALDGAGARWCLLRGEDELDDPDGDVDVLVDAGDLADADSALRAVGAVALAGPGRGTHRKYVARSPDTVVALDVVTALDFGRYAERRSRAAGDVLGRRHHDGVLPLSAPTDSFWLLALHALLDVGAVDGHCRDRLLALAQRTDVRASSLAEVAAGWLGPGWSVPRLLAELSAESRTDVRWRHPLDVRMRAFRRRAVRRAARPWVRRRRGMVVALMGPDGAGKSSLDLTRLSWPERVQRAYAGLYGTDVPERRRFAARVLHARRTLRWARRAARGGALILLDRHPYDLYALDRHHAPAKRRLQRLLLAAACPAPDVAVVLDAPGTVLHARSGEHSAETLEAQRRAYVALASRLPGRARGPVLVVDATPAREAVATGVAEALWTHWRGRVATRGPRGR